MTDLVQDEKCFGQILEIDVNKMFRSLIFKFKMNYLQKQIAYNINQKGTRTKRDE